MANLRRLSFVALMVGAVATTSACKEELTGPIPGIESPSGGGALPVDPGIICRIQHPEGGTQLAISGSAMAPIPFDVPNQPTVGLPDVTLARSSAIDGESADALTIEYGGDPGQPNADLLGWSSQSSMTMAVTDDVGLEPGIYDLTVTNANEESATSGGALAVADRPTPTAITPGLVCLAEADRALTIAGESFLRIGEGEPTVTVGEAAALDVDALADCAAVAHEGVDADVCDTIEFTVPQDYVEPGTHPIVIRNPETAACESVYDEDSVELVVVGPPVIETAEPPTVCSEQTEPISVTFTGSNFINADGESFEVTVNGEAVTPDSVDGCEPIEVDDIEAENCTSFTVTVDPTATPQGNVEVGVTNPASVGCGFSTDMLFTVVGPPVVTSVQPDFICSEQEQSITVTGENFGPNATVTVNGMQADTVDVQSDTELTATFSAGFPAGTFDVTVDNGAGCSGTLEGAVDVLQSPIVFFVDPPVIYNGVAFEVTIFTSGLDTMAAAVELVDPDGNATSLDGFQSPTRPNRILATVPGGLAPGDYEVRVTDEDGCPSAFNGSLTITDDIALNLESIDPSFVSPTVDTAVTITATAPPELTSTPRAYLNPNPTVAGVTATALEAAVLQSSDSMTAVIPGGLTPGAYDLIVVNPTGEVGLISQGVTVVPNEPPVVDSVSPASFATNEDYDAVIRGENFDAAGVTVTLECATSGGRVEYPATVNNVTSTTIDVTLPTGQLSRGDICLVTVTNNADGSSFTYSAISATTSAFNLQDWASAPAMTTARRALALEAGRPTNTSRFLYAVGGDSGTTTGALASAESSAVNVFGEPGPWREQRYSLPGARTFAGITRIDRFLYLVGGSDGSAATNTVWRAKVLDPLDAPEIVDVDAQLGDGAAGLGEGLWMYRVAAVYPPGHPENPNGESLPGEVQNVELPSHPDLIQLTLTWEQVPDAVAYKIYRSPAADDGFDELSLVADIPDGATTTWTDDGAVADMMQQPLRPGSTGVWHPMETLNTAREAHAVLTVPVPGTTDQFAIYAIGGRDGGALASVEYTTVTVGADGSQTMAPWTTAASTLATPLAEMKAFRVRGIEAPAIPAGVDWIYVGPGRNGGTFIAELQAFEVTAGLEPSFLTVNRTPSDRAGYCGGSSNANLYVFGGAGGGASNGGISAELCESTAMNCGDNVPPDLSQGAWNSLGTSMSDSRVHCDVAQESAFYFVAGGSDGAGALSSVDRTVQ